MAHPMSESIKKYENSVIKKFILYHCGTFFMGNGGQKINQNKFSGP